jgi:hypothetical protein
MTQFSDLKIEYSPKTFEGDRIDIDRIFNQEITVQDFKIEETKFAGYKEKGSNKCLYLQILYKGDLRVIFTGSGALLEVIQKVPRDKFPFTTIIVKENKRYRFT